MQEKYIRNQQIAYNRAPRLKFWHYVVIFTVTSLLMSAIFITLTPKTKKVTIKNQAVTTNLDNTVSTFKKISYSGEQIALPETFNVFGLVLSNNSAELLASQIINRNNMLEDERVKNYWVGENSALSKSDYEKNYTFTEMLDKKENDVKIIKDEAIKTCLNFYSKYNIDLKLIPQENSLTYLSQGFEQIEVQQNAAYSIQIPLTYELDGYPVFYENSKDYPFFCKIDNNYNLERVVFKDFFSHFEAVDQMPPTSIDQAISNIKNGTASIISAESQIVSSIDLNWINEADLYSVEIDYRYDDVLKIVYPFYKFRAKLTNSAGINIQATIITPAIATAIEQ